MGARNVSPRWKCFAALEMFRRDAAFVRLIQSWRLVIDVVFSGTRTKTQQFSDALAIVGGDANNLHVSSSKINHIEIRHARCRMLVARTPPTAKMLRRGAARNVSPRCGGCTIDPKLAVGD